MSRDVPPNILRRALVRNRWSLAAGSLLIALHQGCEALVPIVIGVIVDHAVATGSTRQLVLWIAALAGLFLLLTAAYRTGARQLMRTIADEAHLLRLEVAAKVLDPRAEVRTGDVLTISATDADHTSYLLDYIPRMVGALTATAVSAAGLCLISVRLGLVVLIGTPLVVLALRRASPRITHRVADRQEVAGRASSLATDLVTGLRPVRGIGAQDAAAARYREVSRESLHATMAAARTQGAFMAASTTVSTLLACGIAVLAGWFALTGKITVGQLVTVIGLAAFLAEPFATLATAPGWIASARASADRITCVLRSAPAAADRSGPPPPHPAPPHPASSHATPPHAAVPGPAVPRPAVPRPAVPGPAVPGPAVLPGPVLPGPVLPGPVLLRPADGECVGVVVTPDAAAFAELYEDGSPDVLVVPHHPDLFTGTIRDNLLRGGPLDDALRASAADDVVAAHPDGLDHEIAERGAALSGGQRQRLALARALLAGPAMLVLHDPTTAVDAVTEHAIARGIRDVRHRPGSTLRTLLVTTSPALLAVTDRVVVLRGGTVVATGTHDELVATDPDYRAAVLR